MYRKHCFLHFLEWIIYIYIYLEHDAWSSCIHWFRSCHPTREFILNSKTLRFTDGCIPCFPGSGLRWLSLVSWLPVTYGRQLSHETHKKNVVPHENRMSHPGWLLGILILAYYNHNPYVTWVGFHPRTPYVSPNQQGALFSLLNCYALAFHHGVFPPPCRANFLFQVSGCRQTSSARRCQNSKGMEPLMAGSKQVCLILKRTPTYPWSIPQASPNPQMKGIPSETVGSGPGVCSRGMLANSWTHGYVPWVHVPSRSLAARPK